MAKKQLSMEAGANKSKGAPAAKSFGFDHFPRATLGAAD
jgi:hypothetical protein